MACDPLRPTPQDLFEFLKGSFETNVLKGGIVRPASPEWWVVQNDYKVAEHLLSMTSRMWRETDPRYACCDNLVAMASGVDGVHPRAATFAEGYVRITGAPGSVLVKNLQVNFGGAYYRPTNLASVPAVIPPSGYVLVRFRAVQPGPGASTPQEATAGTLLTPLTGVDREVYVHGASFCGGRAAETCEDFRRRYLERRRHKPNLNFAMLEEAALQWPCVTRVCPRGPLCCDDPTNEVQCGTKPLIVHAMFDNSFEHGIAPESVLDEMTDTIFGTPQGYGLGLMPIGVCGRFQAVTAGIVDVIFSGLACATRGQQELIRSRTSAFFATLCPSTDVCVKSVSAIVSQVIPTLCDFDVTFVPRTDAVSVTSCGDLEPGCDVLPVLGNQTMA